MELDEAVAVLQNPFHIFPEEIWEQILEQLGNSHDILNMLVAFPQLKCLPKGKQFSWLITEVLPLILSKFISISDMKSCRLVSKRWMNAVGTCLETHTDRRPYKFTTAETNVTDTHFNYRRLPYIATDFRRFYQASLDSPEIIDNPFPGRQVHFFVKIENSFENLFCTKSSSDTSSQRNDVLWEAVPTMKQFGSHIYYLTFEFPYLGYLDYDFLVRKILRPMFQCLSYLPNLKALKFVGLGFSLLDLGQERSIQAFQDFISAAKFPFHLETLQISLYHFGTQSNNLHRHLVNAFVNHDHVKKLMIKSDCWNTQYSTLFPNLSELCLILIPFEKRSFQNTMQDLRNSSLTKLEIRTWGMPINDLLELLVSHQIESLQIFGRIEELPTAENKQDKSLLPLTARLRKSVASFLSARFLQTATNEQGLVISSIKCLSLKVKATPKLGFRFLSTFPALEYLTIEIINGGRPLWKGFTGEQNGYTQSQDFILKSLYNFYNDGENSHNNFRFIWDEFPNLKLLTVNKNNCVYQYARECDNAVFFT